jgi:hypothetical protein
MPKALLKTGPFWVGLVLYEVSTVTAIVLFPNTQAIPGWANTLIKIAVILIMIMLYYLYARYKSDYMTQAERQKLLETMLACVDQVRRLDASQNLRSNIFVFDRKKRIYRIVASHNMADDDDRNVEIPENLGCTGEAWRSRGQVWGPKGHILHVGDHRIPEDQVKKIRTDLEWICSTPITDWDGNVIAVLNFDGNKAMNDEQQLQIKQQASRLASELGFLLASCKTYAKAR